MSVVRLTERKLKDARFRKNEEALFGAFFEDMGKMKLSVGELAQKIGVSRVTIYRHHQAICEIEEEYERYILEKYVKLMRDIKVKDNIELRRLYYEMVIFILRDKKIFGMLIKRRNLRVIGEMVGMLRSEVRLPSNSERIFRVYVGGIVGLIMDWGLGGFQETEIVKLLNNMMYLTESAKRRLLLLAD